MLFSFFNSALYFKWGYLLAASGLKKINPVLYYCGVCLNNPSLRLPKKSADDFFISLRIYKRILYQLCSSATPSILESGITEAIIDANAESRNIRINYLDKYSGDKKRLFISKDTLLAQSTATARLFFVIYLVVSSIPVFLFSIFARRKSNLPLLVMELLECSILLGILKKSKIKYVHYFSIYERDSNMVSFLLMKSGIYVNKIPSEVPLAFWNKVIVADELSFCFKYQTDEFIQFKETMFVSKTKMWAPEQVLNAKKEWLTKEKKIVKNNIGFYSSANWLRDEIGNVDLGKNEAVVENGILTILRNYVIHKPEMSICIFLHPLEKMPAYKAKVEEHYRPYLNEQVRISPIEVRTADAYNEVEIAVAQFSTIMFERIYFGFKTLIVPFGFEKYFIEESPFRNILAFSNQELVEKIEHNLGISEEKYFSMNHLIGYRFCDN